MEKEEIKKLKEKMQNLQTQNLQLANNVNVLQKQIENMRAQAAENSGAIKLLRELLPKEKEKKKR